MTKLERAKQLIVNCEKVLGYKLTDGQKSDLILDNMMDVQGTPESHEIVKQLKKQE